MELSIFFKILISLAIGGAIGLEREVHERQEDAQEKDNPLAAVPFIGVRTISLTTALGAVAGIVYADHFGIFIAITATYFALVLVHYFLSSWFTKDIGTTTEIALIFSFIIGVLIGSEILPVLLATSISVIMMLILSSKDKIKLFVADVRGTELRAFISFGLIALVILPFLPNNAITLGEIPYIDNIVSSFGGNLTNWKDLEIINPFTTWLVVAIITGVDLLGHFLERTVGQGKGLILSSIIGGFVSSTATTQSLAVQSKNTKSVDPLVGAALLATFSSFFSLLIILLPLNPLFVASIIPTLAILILGFGGASFYFMRQEKNSKASIKEQQNADDEVFSIEPALVFAAVYLAIKIISNIGLRLFGETGFLVTSALAGFTGIDAVSINIAQLMGETINTFTAVMAFIIVNGVNLIAKTIYIFLQGKREFTVKYGVTVIAIIAASFAGLLFV